MGGGHDGRAVPARVRGRPALGASRYRWQRLAGRAGAEDGSEGPDRVRGAADGTPGAAARRSITRGPVSPIYELADRYVDRSAVLDPILATSRGVIGRDAEMTDYSPEAQSARASLGKETLAELSRLRPCTEADRSAAEVVTQRLED